MLEQHLQSKKHQQLANRAAAKESKMVEGDESEGPTTTTTIMPPPAPPATGPTVCIFCNRSYRDVDGAVRHMLRHHGFFIPDADFLIDLPGLVTYCNEKVKLGGMCLYCNGRGKQFGSYVDVQRHMEDKSHCKLLYEPGEDKEEFASYYDFTTSYPDDDGMDEDEDDGDAMSEDEEEEEEEEGVEQETAYVSDLGELVLPDGKVLGSRQYRRYYQQRYRMEDTRESVLAIKTEVEERALVMGGIRSEGGSLMVLNRKKRLDPKTYRMNMRVVKAARRHQERVQLRTEINTNRFHKRPQIDG